jgi:hydrogenase expression/formation protein HypD
VRSKTPAKRATDRKLIDALVSSIAVKARHLSEPARIMEICGTHTMDIGRYGLRKLLPPEIELISGPGCPVCVTPISELDRAIETAKLPGVITASFGDMMRVPGTRESLSSVKATGADVRAVYSAHDSIGLALENPSRDVVFIGIGFETTSPTVALTVKEARKNGLKNLFVQTCFKTIIPPLEVLLSNPSLRLNGLIAPGHVSAIIGAAPYRSVTDRFHVPCVVTGFEALDILTGILMIVNQLLRGEGKTEIQYKRAVREEGNPIARAVMEEVFVPVDSNWRGLGVIPGSGLAFSQTYSDFDASRKWSPDTDFSREPAGCRCGEVLTGSIKPPQCPLFGRSCVPEQPVGACMVSAEGTCAAYYRYER